MNGSNLQRLLDFERNRAPGDQDNSRGALKSTSEARTAPQTASTIASDNRYRASRARLAPIA